MEDEQTEDLDQPPEDPEQPVDEKMLVLDSASVFPDVSMPSSMLVLYILQPLSYL